MSTRCSHPLCSRCAEQCWRVAAAAAAGPAAVSATTSTVPFPCPACRCQLLPPAAGPGRTGVVTLTELTRRLLSQQYLPCTRCGTEVPLPEAGEHSCAVECPYCRTRVAADRLDDHTARHCPTAVDRACAHLEAEGTTHQRTHALLLGKLEGEVREVTATPGAGQEWSDRARHFCREVLLRVKGSHFTARQYRSLAAAVDRGAASSSAVAAWVHRCKDIICSRVVDRCNLSPTAPVERAYHSATPTPLHTAAWQA